MTGDREHPLVIPDLTLHIHRPRSCCPWSPGQLWFGRCHLSSWTSRLHQLGLRSPTRGLARTSLPPCYNPELVQQGPGVLSPRPHQARGAPSYRGFPGDNGSERWLRATVTKNTGINSLEAGVQVKVSRAWFLLGSLSRAHSGFSCALKGGLYISALISYDNGQLDEGHSSDPTLP